MSDEVIVEAPTVAMLADMSLRSSFTNEGGKQFCRLSVGNT